MLRFSSKQISEHLSFRFNITTRDTLLNSEEQNINWLPAKTEQCQYKVYIPITYTTHVRTTIGTEHQLAGGRNWQCHRGNLSFFLARQVTHILYKQDLLDNRQQNSDGKASNSQNKKCRLQAAAEMCSLQHLSHYWRSTTPTPQPLPPTFWLLTFSWGGGVGQQYAYPSHTHSHSSYP